MNTKTLKLLSKDLKAICADLPVTYKEVPYRKYVNGDTLIKEGIIKTKTDEPVDEKLQYIRWEIKLEVIDHYKEARKYIKKFGATGLDHYKRSLSLHRARLALKYPGLNPKPPVPIAMGVESPRISTPDFSTESVYIPRPMAVLPEVL